MSGYTSRGLSGLSLTLLLLVGCTKNDPPTEAPAKPVAQTSADEKKEASAAKPVPGKLTSMQHARLHQPFKDAVLLEPPADELRPPDMTVNGKNVAQLFESIAGKDSVGGLWDQIPFVGDDGRTLKYQVVLTTQAGEIAIDLNTEEAPNHCRNFIALAKAGYFDGLPFYRSVRMTAGDKTVAYVESGCPKGTGEVGYGSIGYWLKPEISDKLSHEEGAVGAWHREELETAACRFYIAAQPMKQMDGSFTIFGKVSRGMDVVRTMNMRPVGEDDRLKEPVLIQRATIQVN